MPSLTRPTWAEQSNRERVVNSGKVPSAVQGQMP